MIDKVEIQLAGRTLSIESGHMAKQADGAVVVRYGDTVVLATVVAEESGQERDFFPLFVEYRQKTYAAGRIPGNIFKREGRPLEKEILSARLIDHQIRPLFPEEYGEEVQVMVFVLSSDDENDADILGMIGASAALTISDVPFLGPVGAVRVGRVNGDLILNPTFSQIDEGDLDIVVSGTRDSIASVEGAAKEIPEEVVVEALQLGHEGIREIVEALERMRAACGKPKREVRRQETNEELIRAVQELCEARIHEANEGKEARSRSLKDLEAECIEKLAERFPDEERRISSEIERMVRDDMRRMILDEGQRIDGRGLKEIRAITCDLALLPRTHGSALFTRGETQSLAVATLGSKMDERLVDHLLEGKQFKSYMLDYNFPPFSVGEVRPVRGPGRREIGHGALAEKAIAPVIPSEETFPYTIRVVSDILESNSSSSMATVCAGSLALMDAGVPVKAAVAGIGIGLIREEDRSAILTDMIGTEDHLGDMDLKVAGTRDGITALQMDIKVAGIDLDTIGVGLAQAHTARMQVLDIMGDALSVPRPELSPYAPRILSIKIDPTQIGTVIGPKGAMIREIEERTGAQISIEDDGTIIIAAVKAEGGTQAREIIEGLVEEPEVGKVYDGKVKRIMEYGAFVEILPGKEGLLHISELEFRHVPKVEDVIQEGETVKVKVIGLEQGRIKLSRKALLGDDQRRTEGEGGGRNRGRRRESK